MWITLTDDEIADATRLGNRREDNAIRMKLSDVNRPFITGSPKSREMHIDGAIGEAATHKLFPGAKWFRYQDGNPDHGPEFRVGSMSIDAKAVRSLNFRLIAPAPRDKDMIYVLTCIGALPDVRFMGWLDGRRLTMQLDLPRPALGALKSELEDMDLLIGEIHLQPEYAA